MKFPVRVKAAAEREMADAASWYDAESVGLGRQFLAAVADQISAVAAHPLLYRECGPGIRLVPVRRFPYLLYYTVERECVYVLACLHSRRSPALRPSRK